MRERESVILGSLLHDVGKFYQRSSKNENELSQQTKNMEGQICPYDKIKNCFTHRHALWTNEFFEKYKDRFPINVNQSFSDNALDTISNFACYHHLPSTDLHKIVTYADRLSAGIDRNKEKRDEVIEGGDKYKKVRLRPIFESITLTHPEPEEKYRYELNPLELNEEIIFSKPISRLNPPEGEYLTKAYKENLWDNFLSEFQNLPHHNFNIFFNSLFSLLQKYTWCIPSSTIDYPDISLFDHLKATSAIASCLYDYENSNKENDKEFLLLAGDISGIQNFIYKITQTEGAPGISKRLRGRSFYVSLLAEVVSKKIINDLDLTIANITFCGGGRFEILLPNTQGVKVRISQIENETNNWLIKNFESELGLIIETLELNSDELKKYSDFLSKLDYKLSLAKKIKFHKLLFEDVKSFIIPIGKDIFGSEKVELKNKSITVCKSCNLTLIPKGREKEEDKFCNYCRQHKVIGEFLPETRAIVFAKGNIDFGENTSYKIDFDELGKVYLIRNEEIIQNKLNDENIIEIKLINKTQTNLGGFGFLGNTMPTAKENFAVTIHNEEHMFEKDDILDFEAIAHLSTGDKRLGLLKMDVDYLGLIFAIGLEKEKKEESEYNPKSISRISTLSRMLDLFFAGFLNNICDEVYNEWHKETNCDIKDKIKQIFYISYSGGDDLLIIGPWSEMPKLAQRIREKFKKFTCYNKNFDVSTGIFLIKPKFPIGRAAVMTGEELEKSKDKGRNRITLFDETVRWDKNNDIGFDELFEFGETLYELATTEDKDNRLARGFVHSLIRKRNQFIKDNETDLNYIPSLIYQITRNVKEKAKIKPKGGEEKKLKDYLWQKLITEQDGKEVFRKVKLPASYALLKSRKEE